MMRGYCVALIFFAAVQQGFTAELSSPNARSNGEGRILASKTGATLNSDLTAGGGTDDTAALQRILDRAKSGRQVHLVVDGPALISGLTVYGNTTLECTDGGGFFLRENADRTILRNAHRSRSHIVDENITIKGCRFNGNRDGQRYQGRDLAREHPQLRMLFGRDGILKTGLQFMGIRGLTIEDVSVTNARAFGVWLANAENVTIHGIEVLGGLPSWPKAGTSNDLDHFWENFGGDDGIHIGGPAKNVSVVGARVRTMDDALALNADDTDEQEPGQSMFYPFEGHGPITDVTFENVELVDTFQGIRILSSSERVDRVIIRNLRGSVLARGMIISHFTLPGHGDVGTITFQNVHLKSGPWPFPPYQEPATTMDWAEETDMPLFSVNARVENLNLYEVTAEVEDERPVLRLGRDASVSQLNGDFATEDRNQKTPLVQVLPQARVKLMNLSLRGSTP